MRWMTDDEGRSWKAERVGRTSGIVRKTSPGGPFPEPQDIIRFSCEAPGEADREVTAKAGLLEQLTESELKALLQVAPRAF
jgi:hypothetical protein